MSSRSWTDWNVMRRPAAGAVYVALMVTALVASSLALSAISQHRAAVAEGEAALAQLEERSLFARRDDGSPLGEAPAGSPFLEGQTISVAGAALLQRVASAINRIGGTIISSEVDLQKADAKNGWIGLVVSCEVEQPALQRLLYDIEAGMPFLFLDQFVVDPPSGDSKNGRMRVLLGVSGQWGGK
jgi:general secretion pathway protein M